MPKRLKLKFSRVISSFQFCRSKDPSTLPSNPVPSFLRLSPVKLNLPVHRRLPSSSSKPRHSVSLKRHMSSAFTSISCSFRSKPSSHYLSKPVHSKPPPNFHQKKEDNWHVVPRMYELTPRQKICTSFSKNDTVTVTRTTKRRQKRASRLRIRTDEEEAEALVFSAGTDSSNFRKKKASSKRPKRRRRGGGGGVARDYGEMSPARLSRFQWMIPCTVEGKVRESFAVVKRSEDPEEDFKRSMIEMIREKEMFDVKDLEQLLHCFLSLNSRSHHGVIIHTFSQIWDTLLATNLIRQSSLH